MSGAGGRGPHDARVAAQATPRSGDTAQASTRNEHTAPADMRRAPPPAPGKMPQGAVPEPPGVPMAVFVVFALAYLLAYGLRSVNATLAPYLTADLGLTPAGLGGLSSAYFVAFAALQLPLGHWLDRHGARRVESVLLGIAATGALLMAIGADVMTVTAGRVLVGVGVSACLMAPYTYFRRCCTPERQAQLSQWMLAAGTSGAVIATLPTGALAAALGWRAVFGLIALLLLGAALAIHFLVPDRDRAALPAAAQGQPATPLAQLLRHRAILLLLPLALISNGGVVALQTLWAGPYMTQVLGLDNAQMARMLLFIMLTLMGAYLAMSFSSARLQRRFSLVQLGVAGHAASIPVILAIALLPWREAAWLWLLLVLTVPLMSMVQPGLAVLFPRAHAGRILTLYNLFIFLGAFVMQWGIGLVIEALQGAGVPARLSYQLTLGMVAVLQMGCFGWWALWRRRLAR